MHNDKNIIKNRYLPNLPYLTPEGSRKFYGIMFTLCALSFFGFFAISPTVSTILKLKKEISDNQFVLSQMEIKIKNLTGLRKQYFSLQDDLPTIMNAITVEPDVHLLFAQIQSVAKTSNIAIKKLQNFEVEVLKQDDSAGKNYYSYSFSIGGNGSSENISEFVSTLTNMERVINIDTFSINNVAGQESQSLGFDIQGTAFFKSNL